MRRLTRPELYRLVSDVHGRLPTLDGLPDLTQMDSQYLDEIRRGLVGARWAVNGLEKAVVGELEGRGERLAPVIPLRPVELFDPEKHEREGA